MIDLINWYRDFANNYWWQVWIGLAVVGYVAYIYLVNKFDSEVDWTDGAYFTINGVVSPLMVIIALGMWPALLPLVIVIGVIVGIFYLNKYRMIRNRKSDAFSGW